MYIFYNNIEYVFSKPVIFSLLFTFSLNVNSEITTDNSLGTIASSLTGPDYSISHTLGLTEGTNLFHSFSVFNVNTGETATFTGPGGIDNIFSRVTGPGVSTIDGGLGSSIAGANLYFINPNGIVFGDNATLNLSGSFYASTADYITLQDGSRFDVSQSSDVTLTSSPISAFGFIDDNISGIQINKSNLSVVDGESLGLIAGGIDITGDAVLDTSDFTIPENAELIAANGKIELITLASSGEADIRNQLPIISDGALGGNINITKGAEISVRGSPGGRLVIRGGNLVIQGAVLDASNDGPTHNLSQAVDIQVTGKIEMTGEPDFAAKIRSSSYSSGHSGNVIIKANEIVQNGLRAPAVIETSAFAQGSAGDIEISADSYRATGGDGRGKFDGITSVVFPGAIGDSSTGNIKVDVRKIELFNSAQISTDRKAGSGKSGDIDISSRSESILISGRNVNRTPSGIFSSITKSGTSGSAGNISIITGNLTLENFAMMFNTVGRSANANGGDINIIAKSITLKSAGLISSSNLAFGQSGEIGIETQTFNVFGSDQVNPAFFNNQSGVFSSIGTVAAGASDINITAHESISVLNGGAISADTFGTGDGGNIMLMAPQINISGWNESTQRTSIIGAGARVFDAKPTGGDGGNINILGDNVVINDRARVTVENFTGAIGDAGNVNVTGDNIIISDGSLISAVSSSKGIAGNIVLQATDSLIIKNSAIKTETIESDGGNITLMAKNLMTLDNSFITTSVEGGSGNGGNISIDPELLYINKTNIIANSFGGAGGNINLQADNLIISKDSNFSASSELGVDGQLIINTNNEDAGSQIEKVSATPSDDSIRFKQNCASEKGEYSSFVIEKITDSIFDQTGLIFISFDNPGNSIHRNNLVKNVSTGCSISQSI